MLTMDITYF